MGDLVELGLVQLPKCQTYNGSVTLKDYEQLQALNQAIEARDIAREAIAKRRASRSNSISQMSQEPKDNIPHRIISDIRAGNKLHEEPLLSATRRLLWRASQR